MHHWRTTGPKIWYFYLATMYWSSINFHFQFCIFRGLSQIVFRQLVSSSKPWTSPPPPPPPPPALSITAIICNNELIWLRCSVCSLIIHELQLSSVSSILHWFLCRNILYNKSLLSKIPISLVANSCMTEICRQHRPLEVQDFGVKLQPGYQLACRIYSVIQL